MYTGYDVEACISALCCCQHHTRQVQCWWMYHNLMDAQIEE